MSDQFQRTWKKAVTTNGGKLCIGDFVISDIFKVTITDYEVGWTCSMQEAGNKCVLYIRKKFLTWINWDVYTWKSMILKLILNKQDVKEWIRLMCQVRAH